jgi:diguanylate cyclase (GGDEF)-like protein/PAS domain S-box-containing protein
MSDQPRSASRSPSGSEQGSFFPSADDERSPLAVAEDLVALTEASLDMLAVLDEQGTPLMVSPASRRLFGFDPEEFVGANPLAHVHPDDRESAREQLRHLIAGEPVRHVYRMVHRDGHAVWVESAGQPTSDRRRFVVVTREVSDQVEHQRWLTRIALRDPLTGLHNRRSAMDTIGAAVSRAERADTHLALLFIDLDDFKAVNDRHGHAYGDAVLRSVAHRLSRAVRRGDLVARIGGDEFIVLMENLPEPAEKALDAVVDKLRERLAQPHAEGGIEASVPASIGAAHWRTGMAPTELIHAADHAMYQAKRRVVFVDSAEAVGPRH